MEFRQDVIHHQLVAFIHSQILSLLFLLWVLLWHEGLKEPALCLFETVGERVVLHALVDCVDVESVCLCGAGMLFECIVSGCRSQCR